MLKKILEIERIQLPCWIPVFIAIGILIGFRINPINYWLLATGIATLLAARIFYFNLLLTSICCILIGILSLQVREQTIDSPTVNFEEKYSRIWGSIDNITPLEHGYRVSLSKLFIVGLDKKMTPKKIRLTVRTNLNGAKIGNRIQVNAILSKPMQPYIEGSYDFARDAYFKQIGAVGYSVSNLTILDTEAKSWKSKLNSLRNNIQTRVNDTIGSYYGSIATALMLNEYSNIDKNILKDLRATGLAHILSVSGMHLSLVAAIFFFSSRFLLNCIPAIALRVNCKKIAAFISLIGSLGYLLISGMEVAAVRSFLMSSMIIIAIIIDRTSNPMRAIAFAATLILVCYPENIIHPSFQMSFSAVIALVACFEIFSKLRFDFASFNLIQKSLFYFLSLSFASLVAGLATAPFALYHFSQSANYSILANLLAVPVTSFWLMPCVVLAFLLYPIHLEFLSLVPMKYGIELMLKIAHYIATLPYSVSSFAKISDLNLLIIVFGMLCFCICHSRIRLAGIAIIATGIIAQSFVTKADIFIDWENKTIAVVDSKNQLIYLNNPLAKFKRQLLMNHLGIDKTYNYNNIKSEEVLCQNQICYLHKDNYQVTFYIETMDVEIAKDNKLLQKLSNKNGTALITLKDYGR